MKYKSLLYLLVAALLVTTFAVSDVVAQDRMTRDQWQQQMSEVTQKRDELRQRLNSLESEINGMNEQIAAKRREYQACRQEILAMVGATDAQVRSLVERIQQLENQVSGLERLSDPDLLTRRGEVDEVKKAIEELKKNRHIVHPEVYDRLMALDQRVNNLLDRLGKMVQIYTVGTWSRDRDCLWNIAKKGDVYSNAWLWPRIWQANRDQIRDPDIIHPGQRLQVPPKGDGRMTTEEQQAANRYYREVREGLR
jgi:predicted nuclease with TOPRIM domain